MNDRTFLIAGGDLRQTYLAASLARQFRVYTVGFDKGAPLSKDILPLDGLLSLKERVDTIVLPLPASSDGVTVRTPFSGQMLTLDSLPVHLKPGGLVLAGRVDDHLRSLFADVAAEVIDYFDREELAVLNAIPTAEGALQIAMEELPVTIFGLHVLLTGFGRISKALARMLVALGASVTVAARRFDDLAWARIYGCKTLHLPETDSSFGEYDLIINTVPAMLLNERRLALLKKGALVIDLASKPGGVDFDTARRLGVKTIWALSLPGKVAPVSSGEIIADTIRNLLRERGERDA